MTPYFGWKCLYSSSSSCDFSIVNLLLPESYVEGSSYRGKYAVDYLMLDDERAGFDANTDPELRKKYLSIVGCTVKETGMF